MNSKLVEFLSAVMSFVLILIGVGFFIVLERKVLGVVQIRLGPNKPSFKGILQVLADGVKMITKGLVVPSKANKWVFSIAPVVLFSVSYCIWVIFPTNIPGLYFKFSILFFLAVSAANVFGIIMCGWGSNSSYAMLGAMRAVAQSISYEVSMAIVLLCPLIFHPSFEFKRLQEGGFNMVFVCLEVFFLWAVSVVAETNRAPFDFVEGESELVAGYHVEMGGFMFGLIALAEYGAMVVMSFFSIAIFMANLYEAMKVVMVVLACMLFVLIRGSLPRYRYDKLMDFCWKVVLPVSLSFFMLSLAM